jgi:hypothetical protein
MTGPVDVLAVLDSLIEYHDTSDSLKGRNCIAARAAVADQKSDLEFLRDRLRNEVRAREGRSHRSDGSASVETMIAEELHAEYMAQLAGFADDLDAALARVSGAA